MRTEKDILSLIINVAEKDDRIRAVIMNGSRANPNAPKDILQDYDVVYVVKAIRLFIENPAWIDIFGERIMLQKPEEQRDPCGDGRFIYLMLFSDGNRIDLSLFPIEKLKKLDTRDSESILLLDKDNIIVPYPAASDKDYHLRPPTVCEFNSCCNNFWWCSQNVVKGIWRDELAYTMFMYNRILRDEFHFMIAWYIGIKTDFNVSIGKQGKYFKHYLDQGNYRMFEETYANSDYENVWQALLVMCSMFRKFAKKVAANFDFIYPQLDDDRMTAFLYRIKDLPQDAKEIY